MKKQNKMQEILIVEDDEKLRNELIIFLSNNGYEIEFLAEFENCIEKIIIKSFKGCFIFEASLFYIYKIYLIINLVHIVFTLKKCKCIIELY